MININFTKPCNISKLHTELEAAGFSIAGVSYDGGSGDTIVHLNDMEIKDPSAVIDAHVFTADVETDWKQMWADANSVDVKLDILAQRLGIA